MNTPVSIIILSTYPSGLELCLKSLIQYKIDPNFHELIIITDQNDTVSCSFVNSLSIPVKHIINPATDPWWLTLHNIHMQAINEAKNNLVLLLHDDVEITSEELLPKYIEFCGSRINGKQVAMCGQQFSPTCVPGGYWSILNIEFCCAMIKKDFLHECSEFLQSKNPTISEWYPEHLDSHVYDSRIQRVFMDSLSKCFTYALISPRWQPLILKPPIQLGDGITQNSEKWFNHCVNAGSNRIRTNGNFQVKHDYVSNRLKLYEHINISIAPPQILQLEVTKNCNNACIMCHKGQNPDFIRTDMNDVVLEGIKPIFPYLKYVMLFGDGEPLLYRHFWKIVEDIRLASPDCSIDFINNGSMMHEKNIDRVIKYKINHMGLSMGGATKKTHEYIRKLSDFNKVVNNFKNLKQRREQLGIDYPKVSGYIVVMKSNHKELPDFIKLAYEMGISHVEFQHLFVTHPSVNCEKVSSSDVEPYFKEAADIAHRLGIGLRHYTLENGINYSFHANGFSPPHIATKEDSGYCMYKQPWNTVYVLHDGAVVPDCHWWHSTRETDFNVCGTINEKTNILDIWRGPIYCKIRERIQKLQVLPQCRGCGLAGGVKEKHRSADTDHASPDDEKNVKIRLTVIEPQPKEVAEVKTDTVSKIYSMSNETSKAILKKLVPESTYDSVKMVTKNEFSDKFHSDPYVLWRQKQSPISVIEHDYSRITKFNPKFDYKSWLDNINLVHREKNRRESILKSQPIYIDMELRNVCNLSCIHCNSAVAPRGQFLGYENIRKIMQIMRYAEIVELSKIAEPLVRKLEFMESTKAIRRFNPLVIMKATTNGMLLDEEIINHLVNIEFECLTASIDSDNKELYEKFRQHSNFDKITESLTKLKEAKESKKSPYPALHVSCQVSSWVNLPAVVDLCHSLGANSLWFSRVAVYEENNRRYNIKQITDEYYKDTANLEKQLAESYEKCKKYQIAMGHSCFDGIDKQYDYGPPLTFIMPTYSGRYDPYAICPTDDPWYRFCSNPTGNISPCCFHGTFDNINGKEIEELRNHPFLVKLRQTMANGKRGPGCGCFVKK